MDILIKQEMALHQYKIRHSKAEITRLLHPNFREVGKSGNCYTFHTIVTMMANEKSSSSYIHSQHYECIEIEPSVQLLQYQSCVIDDNSIASDFAIRASIWVRVDKLWRLKYHQGTPCQPFELVKFSL